jgi:formate dehydrogenase accessory protein FdhD
VEKFFNLTVENFAKFEILCSPIEMEPLIYGTLFTRGIIEQKEDVDSLEIAENLIKVKIKNYLLAIEKYNNFSQQMLTNFATSAPFKKHLNKIAFSKIIEAMTVLHQSQKIFPQTGSAHAALIFNAQGENLAFAEDVGRHNALDKVIGKCILAGRSFKGCALALSSRISFEMAAKAARAGFELVAAVSAPSSLAIEVAKNCHMTLCGFVRNGKANIYCGDERIVI